LARSYASRVKTEGVPKRREVDVKPKSKKKMTGAEAPVQGEGRKIDALEGPGGCQVPLGHAARATRSCQGVPNHPDDTKKRGYQRRA